MCVRVTVMCCYSTVQYSVTIGCVYYSNVLLQYSTVQCYCYVCVRVMCYYSTVQYSVTVMDVFYCNVLVQYSTVQRYSYVCVLQ